MAEMPPGTRRRREPTRTLVEAVAVAAAGLALALASNALSPRGLRLGRDYFPAVAPVNPAAPIAPQSHAAPPAANPGDAPGVSTNPSAAGGLADRMAARGLQLIELAEVQRLYADPRRAQELILFVDARNDRHYLEGHIPGAYQFDHYYPENHLPHLLPACHQAEIVVVYCGGGDCEDSEFAAVALKDAGIPAERLRVYHGGITEWSAAGQPVEAGARGSGEVTVKGAAP